MLMMQRMSKPRRASIDAIRAGGSADAPVTGSDRGAPDCVTTSLSALTAGPRSPGPAATVTRGEMQSAHCESIHQCRNRFAQKMQGDRGGEDGSAEHY